MLIQKEPNTGPVSIKHYSPGKIHISGQDYQCTLHLTPTSLTPVGDDIQFSTLTTDYLLSLTDSETEVLIIGTGESHQFISTDIVQTLNQQGVAIEVMATRQACHTFQVLNYELRKVVALLFL
ncbi:MTH938/NDUFAF3 family protein [Aliikangiella maris]|uniref:Mth938-like domain-containing protein n=2 Tax=Aliikangiella maris TaxID=3162458 RepID=A0ABV2BNL3_9GAMM